MLGEAFEGARPPARMIVAHGDRMKLGLVQGKSGSAVEIRKCHRHERLGTGNYRSVVSDVGQDQPLGGDELTIDTMLVNNASIGARIERDHARPAARPSARKSG